MRKRELLLKNAKNEKDIRKKGEKKNENTKQKKKRIHIS